tara:strand:- start:15342 stop:15599 length:258 start_codon:yes stop_codon:yes gene_type:complete
MMKSDHLDIVRDGICRAYEVKDPLVLALTDFDMLMDSVCDSFCRSCGEMGGQFEPDYRNGKCETCGAMTVTALQELMIEFASEVM